MPDFNSNGVDDVEEVDSWLLARGLRFLAGAWRGAARAVRGVKTLFLGSVLGLVALVDEVGGVDLLQSLKYQLGDESPKLGRWILGISIAFMMLRVFTSTKVGGEDGQEAPLARSADDGDVGR